MGVTTVLTCDTCGKSKLEFSGPYHVVKDEMKSKGWRNKMVGDVWKIFCDECLKKSSDVQKAPF